MHPIYHLLNILNERGELTEAQKALVDEMPYEELYEITSDPYETKNLAKSPNYLDVLDGMRYELDFWIDITSDLGLCEDNYEINNMLEDGFSSDRYSAILGNLMDNGFLNKKDVDDLLEEFITLQKISFDGITDEKTKIVSEALIDNYNRQKFK